MEDFETRIKYSVALLKKYPDRIPVIIRRNPNDKILRDIDREKYLIPKNLRVSEIHNIIRKKITLDSKQALFIFAGSGVLVPMNKVIEEIYNEYKNDDGFLYIVYTAENTFG
jgi:GABA(A) receptor-associated protein